MRKSLGALRGAGCGDLGVFSTLVQFFLRRFEALFGGGMLGVRVEAKTASRGIDGAVRRCLRGDCGGDFEGV